MNKTIVIEGAPGSGKHKLLEALSEQSAEKWYLRDNVTVQQSRTVTEYVLEYATGLAKTFDERPNVNSVYFNAELRPLAKILDLDGEDVSDEDVQLVDQVRAASDIAYSGWAPTTVQGCKHNLLVCLTGYHESQEWEQATETWSGRYRRLYEAMRTCMANRQPQSLFCRHLWSLLATRYDDIIYIDTNDDSFESAAEYVLSCLPKN